MDNKKKKDMLIIVMLVAVVCMSGAFAMLSQKLENSGVGVKGNWGVEITDVEAIATQGNGNSLSVNSDLSVATFAAELFQPGDSVTYNVTVENKGNIDASLESITSNATPVYGADDNPYVVYTYDGITSGSVLRAGEKITFAVTIQYSNDATIATAMNANLTTILNYVQYVE